MDKILTDTLKELEITQREYWNIPVQTGNFLNMLIKMNNSKHVLEIGTSNGYSGLWLLSALKETSGHLSTIEFYDKRQDIAKKYFKKCGFDGMFTAYTGSALEVIKDFPKDLKFDFVFIDANKREYIDYYRLIKPHLLPHSIIAADNVNSHREKVQPFLDLIGKDTDFQTEILDFPGGLSISYMV